MGLWGKLTGKEEKKTPPLQLKTASAPQKPASASGATVRMGAVSRLPGLSQVNHIIAVASGKGGVGKSTVSVNLALALTNMGYKVGLLDSDIYGPSQGTLLGSYNERPKTDQGAILPLEKHGLKFISMSALMGDNAPVIWRAPMATKAVGQFLNIKWGELDYLLIDLPPGTGDIQITLAQQASLSGAIIVSTPQQVAVGIAKKGLQMFQQVNIPIIGVVENMASFVCEHCHQTTSIFGHGGAKALGEEVEAPFLGTIPLDPKIMKSGDEGVPLVLAQQGSEAAKAFTEVATKMHQEVERLDKLVDEYTPEKIDIAGDGSLQLKWPDGLEGNISAFDLRSHCPCASCVDENTGKRILDPKTIPLDIKITALRPVGRYGVTPNYSYPHDSGIFKFERLRNLVAHQSESFSV